ncbi:holin family protein [Aliiroseovarius sp. KMU-50]|uniref:Holin family protein n=1 Tax=Aliiroseovarius salicola TaxID=3009082 RepID=A0ABT4W0B3_9RHOB|nr:holin family protein [Aliiroseovarius sp. KMU-50]MDA5093952.1 holin family protein [Aliiroseovarius sp. KMU-50]
MGLISGVFNILFGSGKNVIRETAEVFVENHEAGAARDADLHRATLEAYAAEFTHLRKGGFDRFMDGLNRLPRPALALGTLALFSAAMIDPIWFSARMRGVALVPEPLWWLLGAIVSFYFGARHQAKGQAFQQEIAATLARTQHVGANIGTLENGALPKAFIPSETENIQKLHPDQEKVDVSGNAALEDWAAQHGR